MLYVLKIEDQIIDDKNKERKATDNDHTNQNYYNEEEVKIIAEKIERNLTFEKTKKKTKNGSDENSNNSSISESNRRNSTAQAD